jgi:hypothetical protein
LRSLEVFDGISARCVCPWFDLLIIETIFRMRAIPV